MSSRKLAVASALVFGSLALGQAPAAAAPHESTAVSEHAASASADSRSSNGLIGPPQLCQIWLGICPYPVP
ncbi:hypothetical protein [Nocardiopsis algeriensis]|uniref:Uncharacterized protein n=1 Tax=Nocardiopsis algeriensis TaxID=1478215 RepID=A0A841IQ01_9ACTN|nr:hypothetical protein [Nocardiopsis algeriensis]MBB6118411.1 hypothetical protein [Nocardiopsis algeriensis]